MASVRGVCKQCGNERSIATCGLCSNCAFKRFVLPFPDKLAAWRLRDRSYRLWSKYHITLEQYDDLLKAQDGKCAICGVTDNGKTRDGKNDLPFCVDHNHGTGETRGLLCTMCNHFVGLLETKPIRYETVKWYLAKFDSNKLAEEMGVGPKDPLESTVFQTAEMPGSLLSSTI